MSTSVHTGFTSGKSLFRIGEVSRLTDTKPFVLRYWETEFPMLQPVKSPKGHRLYRREDVETVRRIKRLLYDEGFTIAGARRHLREAPNAQQPDGEQMRAQDSPDPMESGGENQFAGAQLSASQQTEHSTRPEESRAQDRQSENQLFTRAQAPATSPISRQVLLDLRDSLRAFLTLLESE
jgi:DNA-binding transcriptional MerR regulator